MYVPDISDKRSKPDGANITQRPFQEPGDSETLHPEKGSERQPKSRLDYHQKCVENTPDQGAGCQLYSVVTSIDETKRDSPLPQASEPSGGCPGLVPPHNSRQDRGKPKPGKGAHEHVAVLIVVLKGVKDAETHEAHRG